MVSPSRANPRLSFRPPTMIRHTRSRWKSTWLWLEMVSVAVDDDDGIAAAHEKVEYLSDGEGRHCRRSRPLADRFSQHCLAGP